MLPLVDDPDALPRVDEELQGAKLPRAIAGRLDVHWYHGQCLLTLHTLAGVPFLCVFCQVDNNKSLATRATLCNP